jgi:hypothetical protein
LKKIGFLLGFLLITFIAGCSASRPDGDYLTGDWTDFIPKKGTEYNSGNKVELRFLEQGVYYYHVEQWTDAGNSKDTCGFYSNEQYSAGKFTAKGNSLYFKGDWTDSYYRESTEFPCIDSSKFDMTYTVKIIDDDKMELRLKSPLPYQDDWRIRDKMILHRVTK